MDHPALPEKKRVESLDYLRGLMALSVMLYHYTQWSYGLIGMNPVLKYLGIYAVGTFFILSGVSLTITYEKRINTLRDTVRFLVKRFFRIAPLFWLVSTIILLTLAFADVLGLPPSEIPLKRIIYNYSLLFGFIKASMSIPVGGWSIGDEMVFYFIFPFLFLLKQRFVLPAVTLASIGCAIYFAFFRFNPDLSLGAQWQIYVHPLNHLFLFMAGIAIAKYSHYLEAILQIRHCTVLALLACLIFAFAPFHGDQINVVSGYGRVILSTCCIVFVTMIFILNPTIKALPGRILQFLGESCYSIYLLHPVVALLPIILFKQIGIEEKYAYLVAIFLTLFTSWLTFRFIEKPMINLGSRLSAKLK